MEQRGMHRELFPLRHVRCRTHGPAYSWFYQTLSVYNEGLPIGQPKIWGPRESIVAIILVPRFLMGPPVDLVTVWETASSSRLGSRHQARKFMWKLSGRMITRWYAQAREVLEARRAHRAREARSGLWSPWLR